MRKNIFFYLSIIITFFMINASFALEQSKKLWLGMIVQKHFNENSKWVYYLYPQFRLIDQSHPLQTALLEGAFGYQLSTYQTVWLGYRWSGHRPYDGFFQENRLFQQNVGELRPDDIHRIISRSRFEEIQRGNEGQIALRFRQRLALEIKRGLFIASLYPYFYDEVFCQLNKTNYTSHQFISENRLFLGFNYYTTSKTWWEIGYMNQYLSQTPLQTQNHMGHVLSITYNIL